MAKMEREDRPSRTTRPWMMLVVALGLSLRWKPEPRASKYYQKMGGSGGKSIMIAVGLDDPAQAVVYLYWIRD